MYSDNHEKFTFFVKAAIETLKKLYWIPDYVICNNWQMSMLPQIFNKHYKNEFKNTKIIYMIHELNDFYSYEIWRTDIESIDIESLENNGEMLVEITTQSQNFFEDISLVGSEKSFYYFIRANNSYGDTIESNIIEGDTTL